MYAHARFVAMIQECLEEVGIEEKTFYYLVIKTAQIMITNFCIYETVQHSSNEIGRNMLHHLNHHMGSVMKPTYSVQPSFLFVML